MGNRPLAAAALALCLAAGLPACGAGTRGSAGGGSTGSSGASASAPSSGTASTWLKDLDATVYTESGEPVLISSLANGKPLVVNFWASWCPYCVDEMPDFQAIYDEYQDRVSFAFVCAGDGKPNMTARESAWLAEQGFKLPAYYDEQGEASASFRAWSLPTTAVFSAEGELTMLMPGRIDADLLRGALASMR